MMKPRLRKAPYPVLHAGLFVTGAHRIQQGFLQLDLTLLKIYFLV